MQGLETFHVWKENMWLNISSNGTSYRKILFWLQGWKFKSISKYLPMVDFEISHILNLQYLLSLKKTKNKTNISLMWKLVMMQHYHIWFNKLTFYDINYTEIMVKDQKCPWCEIVHVQCYLLKIATCSQA